MPPLCPIYTAHKCRLDSEDVLLGKRIQLYAVFLPAGKFSGDFHLLNERGKMRSFKGRKERRGENVEGRAHSSKMDKQKMIEQFLFRVC